MSPAPAATAQVAFSSAAKPALSVCGPACAAIEGVLVYNNLKEKVKAFLKPYAGADSPWRRRTKHILKS